MPLPGCSSSPSIQRRLDEKRVRQLESALARHGLCDEDLLDLLGRKRRLVWLERQTAPTVEMLADWQMEKEWERIR